MVGGSVHSRANRHGERFQALVLLGGRQVHKLVKFRPRGMVHKREMEQAQLFETADERGCTPMFGAAHRRESACIGGFPPPAGGPSHVWAERGVLGWRAGPVSG